MVLYSWSIIFMRGNHNNFKIGRSSERSPSPKEASHLRDDNPESRASKGI